jgi:hypothetical protein
MWSGLCRQGIRCRNWVEAKSSAGLDLIADKLARKTGTGGDFVSPHPSFLNVPNLYEGFGRLTGGKIEIVGRWQEKLERKV